MRNMIRARLGRATLVALTAVLLAAPYSASAQQNEPPPATLTGAVTDAAGAPVAGITVTLAGPGEARRTATTDEQGRYAFAGLAPAGYTVFVALGTLGERTQRVVDLAAGGSAVADLHLVSLLQDSVTVSGTVTRELTEVPGGTALVSSEQLDETRRHNMQDVLQFVPGVIAQSRWGADETQLSVRGSGLRNNFHHRGLNLLINGVPYQDADGFGDFETLDLMVVERVELWKGANALRYGGNTLGGALNFVTYSGATGAPLEADLVTGSYGLAKAKAGLTGDAAGGSYFLSASWTDHGGYRDHAEQERTRLFGNLRWQLGDDLEAWVDAIYADVSEKLPGALTRDEFDTDPRQASPGNVFLDSGRFYDYGRLGFGVRRRFGRHSLEATVFGQVRDVLHPIFQILDQDQRTLGGEVRWSYEGAPGGRLERLVVGFAPQVGDNDERRYENLGGATGALVNEFGVEMENLGLYVESQWRLAPRWTLAAGGRWDDATRSYEDRFLADGDRSDERSFSAVSPKVGLLWRPSADAEVFANLSRAYEPPLILELASFGAPGFLALEAQDAWQTEVGTRGQLASGLAWQLSLYDIEIDDEIVNENVRPFPGAPFTVPTYRNADQTRHRGVELGLSAPLASDLAVGGDRLSTRFAYTWSDFRYVDDPAYGDNDLPGAPRHLLRAELRWEHPRGHWIAPNLDWSPSGYFVDSANTVENDSYAVLNLRGGWQWGRLGLFVELVNLSDETYSASVQVDSADGRFFEPADARSFSVGLRWRG